MTWLRLALANLFLAPLTTVVNVVLMGLGTASIVLLLLTGAQLSETLSRDARGIDLVLGAPGSPVQLVLSTVYHADIPPGNISQRQADRWAADPRVGSAIPVSLGDSFRSFRIVGTTESLAALYGAELAAGRFWDESMEAVAGSAAAAGAGLNVDSGFEGAHGLAGAGHSHQAQPYRVVGVLAPTGTVLDRLILTSLESVWDLHADEAVSHADAHDAEDDHEHADDAHVHESDHEHADDAHIHESDHEHADDVQNHESDHEHGSGDVDRDADREITAMLIRYQSPLAALTLPREVNAAGVLQAAAPAAEISRILQLVGIGLDGLRAFAWVLILTAGLSVFAALYGSLRARRGDLAMLRCLGATRWGLLMALLLEGLLLSAAGVALGFLGGHVAVELLGVWLESTRGVALTGWTWIPSESVLIAGLLSVGIFAAAIPAVQAYRTDVATTLAEA